MSRAILLAILGFLLGYLAVDARGDPLGDAIAGMAPGEMRYVALPAPAGNIVEHSSWKSNRTVWIAENGAAFDGQALWFHGGGHNDGAHNGVWKLDLPTLAWSRPFLNQPLQLPAILPPVGSGCVRPLFGPEATHTYSAWDAVEGFGTELDGKILLWTMYASTSNASPSPPCNFTGEGVKAWWTFAPQTGEWEELASNATEAAGTTAIAGWVWQKQVAWAVTPDGIEAFGDKQWCTLRPAPLRFDGCAAQNKTPWWARYVPEVGLVVVTRQAVEIYAGRTLLRAFPLPTASINGSGTQKEADLAGIEPFGRELAWWPGGAVVRFLDLETGQWRVETATGPALPDLTSGATQRATHTDQSPLSKWRWLADRGVFVGVPTPDGVWFYAPQAPPVAQVPCGGVVPGISITAPGTTVAGRPGCELRVTGVDPGGFGVIRTRPGVVGTTIRDAVLTLGDPELLRLNRAAIRAQGRDTMVERVALEYPFGDGLLNGDNCGTVTIVGSRFDRAGGGRNEGHGVYHCSNDKAAGDGRLVIRDSTFIDCRFDTYAFGEAIKSRAGAFDLARVVAGGVSERSHCDKAFNAAHGGAGTITRSVFLQGPAAESDVMLAYAGEVRCADWNVKYKALPKTPGPDLCLPEGTPPPAGYFAKHEFVGDLRVSDSLLVCDLHTVLRREVQWDKPRPCRIDHGGKGSLIFERVKFVGVSGAMENGEVKNPVGGSIVFRDCLVFADRALAGLPPWPEVPRI